MTFLTYAQNFEDVLLWRALKHVKNGFYIDVGANDPELHSVTRAFYDAGWWGINVEPMPSYRAEFERQRPRDINLSVAAGAADGEITLFDTPAVNGWASTDAAVAAAHRAEGVDVVEVTVPLRTLNAICAEHVRGDIHFLKIDVEGFEGDVLRGIDLQRWRPWILVVEATLPNSRDTNHGAWEHLIVSQRYTFAYFDGLNRYYVADEHAELRAALSVQANVFDAFIPYHLDRAWKHAQALTTALEQAEARAQSGVDNVQLQTLVASMNDAVTRSLDAAERMRQADERKVEAERYGYLMEARATQAEQLFRETEQRLLEAQQQLHDVQTTSMELQRTLDKTSEWGHDLERRLLAVFASRSWRITAPVRALTGSRPRDGARALLRKTVRALLRRERLRRFVLKALRRFPALEAIVRGSVAAVVTPPPAPPLATVREAEIPQQLVNLTVPARRVLADLQRGRQAGSPSSSRP